MEMSQVRSSPNWGEIDQFIESHPFSSRIRPNIYFIFFDTLRPDLALARGGAMKRFYNQSWSFEKAYATGTATWYSMFSMFHGTPAFLVYDTFPKKRENTQEYGAIYLKVLKKLGYHLDFLGYDWRCVTSEPSQQTSWSWLLWTTFGYKSRLIQNCNIDPEYGQVFMSNQDEVTLEQVEKRLKQEVTTPEGRFFLLSFYNNHNPYKWGGARSPVSSNVGEKEDFSEPRTTINRYKNSVVASDDLFARLLPTLESLPGHENAIYVLLSDHGEMLYEKKGESGHGGIPYEEKIRILLSMRLSSHHPMNGRLENQSLADILDVFPTVLDELGVQPELPAEMVSGVSLLKVKRKSILSVKSNQSDPTREMVMVNESKKAWVRVDDGDFYRSHTLTLESMTHLDDTNAPELCDYENPQDCREKLIAEFPEAIHELYPNIQTQVRRIEVQRAIAQVSTATQKKKVQKKKGRVK